MAKRQLKPVQVLERLFKRWQRMLSALAAPESAQHGDAVHEGRELLRILRVWLRFTPGKDASHLRAQLAGAYRLSEPARELEVLLALAATLHLPIAGEVQLRWLGQLGWERSLLWRQWQLLLPEFKSHLPALLCGQEAALRRRRRRKQAAKLWRRVQRARRAASHQKTLDAWHALRLALKRYRFFCQLFAPVLPHRHWRQAADCRRLQGVLGQWRDLQLLQARLSQEGGVLPPAGWQQLGRQLRCQRRRARRQAGLLG